MSLYLVGGFISCIITFLWKPLILEFLINHRLKVLNYNNKEVPIGIGVLLLLSTIISIFFFLFITDQPMMYFVYLFGLSLIGFAGILDDLVEETQVKGLKGHLSKMYTGELTSGGLKAIIGGLTALYVSFSFSTDLIDLLLNIFLILLATNTMNLFDVRPGRSIKFYVVISSVIWILSKAPDRFLTLLLIGSIIPVINGDLKEKYMLGDVGSNILGYTIGFTAAISLNMTLKILMVILFILLHVIAEITSITTIINKTPILRYVDDLGRLKQ